MKRSEFYYDLPQELIAQHPVEPRDSSRLFVQNRETGECKHEHFYDLIDHLEVGDCLILNNTKVLPARMYGERTDTKSVVEFLLLNQKSSDTWEILTGPGKKAKVGHKFTFGNGELKAEIIEVLKNGNRVAKFEFEGNFFDVIDKVGEMPLPHYITEKLQDKQKYQTVYAKYEGSAAAPTAGLHFTDELLEKIKAKGVKIGFVTLHVGLGTFRPVKAENIEDHLMHPEHYSLPKETADIINETKASGGRVFAVGTTCIRTLESVATFKGKIEEADDWTSIFIYPGYEFKCVDCLITNFHLPESTLIMLVCAFSGYENIMNAYKIAVEEKYRFFSFGDAMLIEKSNTKQKAEENNSNEHQHLSKKENIIQVIKFALISASAGIIQFLAFTLLTELTDLKHIYCYLPSLILSVIWNFTINRKYTFKSANNVPVAMLKVALFYCVFTPLSTWWSGALADLGINVYIVEIGTMGVNLVTEYLYCRFVVYRNSMNTRE